MWSNTGFPCAKAEDKFDPRVRFKAVTPSSLQHMRRSLRRSRLPATGRSILTLICFLERLPPRGSRRFASRRAKER